MWLDMAIILLIHGPNLNLLGVRDTEHYGKTTLADIEALVKDAAGKRGNSVITFQSNHEGALVDFLQKESPKAAGIIINPGALTHYSYTLHDALQDTKLPAVEVHLSNINSREEWRKVSVTSPACIAQVSGKKELGYIEAMELLNKNLQ
jgi:3-dehydroquinate dehydratase type II